MKWLEVLGEFREDVALFLKLQGRPDVRNRLATQRQDLVQAFRVVEDRLISPAGLDNVSVDPNDAGRFG